LNSASLKAIEDAAFVICLDTDRPSIKDDAARADFSERLWHGHAGCRFYDKPLQWVVFDSGEAGVIGEHSCVRRVPI
jgi:carnitine O-acetyltransferase